MSRRKKSGLGMLDNVLKTKKSGSRGGIEKLGDLRPSRRRRKYKTIGDSLLDRWDKSSKKSKRHKNIEPQQDSEARLKRKLTPTERQQLNAEIERAIEDDQDMRNIKNDATLTRDEGFVRRLVALVRARLRR